MFKKLLTKKQFMSLEVDEYFDLYAVVVCDLWKLFGEGCGVPFAKKEVGKKYNISSGVVEWIYYDRPDMIDFVWKRKHILTRSISDGTRTRYMKQLQKYALERSKQYEV